MYQTIILPVAVDPDAARSGGARDFVFFGTCKRSKRADADGSEGARGRRGGEACQTPFSQDRKTKGEIERRREEERGPDPHRRASNPEVC